MAEIRSYILTKVQRKILSVLPWLLWQKSWKIVLVFLDCWPLANLIVVLQGQLSNFNKISKSAGQIEMPDRPDSDSQAVCWDTLVCACWTLIVLLSILMISSMAAASCMRSCSSHCCVVVMILLVEVQLAWTSLVDIVKCWSCLPAASLVVVSLTPSCLFLSVVYVGNE